MKYRPSQYAQALWAALIGKSEAEQKKIVGRFVELLVRHRVIGKAHAISAAYEKLALQKRGERLVQIETATPASEKLKQEIRTALGKNIHIEERVNPQMLGGVKMLIDDEILIDASVGRQIKNLFIKKLSSSSF